MKEGTSAVLLQSGLDNEWWADSLVWYCYLRNIQDLWCDGKTLYERRFGQPLNRPVIPFKAIVEYHPVSAKDLSRLQQFGPKVFWPKSLARYIPRLCIVCGRICKGDITVADIEEQEEMDTSELHARRLNAQEVLTPMNGDNFIFHFWRRSGSENTHLDPGQLRERRRTK